MSKTVSLLSALLCTFIWGTTFIAQDTGMDNIGPFTFNAVRFFVGFLAIVPLAFLFEVKKFKSEFRLDFKTFVVLSFLIGLSLFLGSALQQVALLYTDVANAAFFTIFYVPILSIPVSWAIKVVPQINVHNNALNNETVFDIIYFRLLIYKQNFFLSFLLTHC